ncbi:DUF1178 family protein [Primorskyibacter sedentarius]|uniref:DUF1178 family protein n=1 Tax=Primorskyibacter sedentarius TaxID=745311 RepID=UPI003EB90256
MIQYTLRCAEDHRFDSWFQSASAFDKLKASSMIACAVCGTTEVEKAIMAPRVSQSRGPDAPDTPTPLSQPATPAEQVLAELRKHVEKNATYVGRDFVSEARAMHDGEAPTRSIWGEAKGEDAKKLIEDGIQVAPLPFMPTRKTN